MSESNSASLRLVSRPEQATANIAVYTAVMENPPQHMINTLAYTRSWIADRDPITGHLRIAPSKFIGYLNMTSERYVNLHQEMDGRETERAMKPWLTPISHVDSDFAEISDRLFDFCARFNQKPNGRFRVAWLVDGNEKPTTPDREALIANLLMAVFETLPADQKLKIARHIKRVG